jgi:hypothetical protein
MSFHLDKERYIELFLLNQISEFMATYAAMPGGGGGGGAAIVAAVVAFIYP